MSLDPLMDDEASLDELLDPTGKRPPVAPGVYVVCQGMQAVYVGKTEQQGGLYDRIGDLVANAIGLYWPDGDHAKRLHSGGRTIRRKMPKEQVLSLHVHWRANRDCISCAEHELFTALEPMHNSQRVGACKEHEPALWLSERN